ncbi:hypothetical protein [Limosilactobacillus vaginalis]|nr:hypothetical protein [Limosilactobacillus vaginalis]
MLESGLAPSTLDKENYLNILEVLKAKPREDRPLNAGEAHKRLAQMFN